MLGVRPCCAYPGAANEAPFGLFTGNHVERTTSHRREGQRTSQQGIQHILLPARTLQVSRQLRQGSKTPAQVVQHQEQYAGADCQCQQDVEVIPPGRPGSPGSQEGIVEVVQSPEAERDRQQRCSTGRNHSAVLQEHPAGPEGGQAQEHHCRPGGPEEMIQAIDRDVRPDGREENQGEIPACQRT